MGKFCKVLINCSGYYSLIKAIIRYYGVTKHIIQSQSMYVSFVTQFQVAITNTNHHSTELTDIRVDISMGALKNRVFHSGRSECMIYQYLFMLRGTHCAVIERRHAIGPFHRAVTNQHKGRALRVPGFLRNAECALPACFHTYRGG